MLSLLCLICIQVVTSPASIFGLMAQLKHSWSACISPFSLPSSLTSGSDRSLIGCYDSYEPYVVIAGLSSFVLFKQFPEGVCLLTEVLHLHKMSNLCHLCLIYAFSWCFCVHIEPSFDLVFKCDCMHGILQLMNLNTFVQCSQYLIYLHWLP